MCLISGKKDCAGELFGNRFLHEECDKCIARGEEGKFNDSCTGQIQCDLRMCHVQHPAGRELPFHWSGNSFITVVYDNRFSHNSWSKARLKIFLQTTIIKLFTDQSEVSVLSVECNTSDSN